MADNTVLNTGTGGDTIATDDIGGIKFQRVKLIKGADGTNDGDVSHTADEGLPVQGEVAIDVAIGTRPVVVGGRASAATPTSMSADNDSQAVWLTLAGAVNVADAGGSLTVDSANLVTLAGAVAGTEMQVDVVAPLPAGTNAIGKLAANTGVDIGDVDVTSVIPGTGATNSGKAIDSVAGATDTGVAVLATRDNALGGVTPAEGDYVNLLVDANGALWTNVNASALPSGASTAANQSTANTALAAIQTAVQLLDDTVGGTELQVDVVGALPAGTNAIGKLAANSGVDIGDVDVTSIIPGTGATNLGKAVDAVAGATDTGVAILAKRDDALGGITPIEGDYATPLVDANGALWVNVNTSALPSGAATSAAQSTSNTALSAIQTAVETLDNTVAGSELQVDVITLPDATVVGKAAHDAAVSGNPVRVGMRARVADITAVAGDDVVDMIADKTGKQIIIPYAVPEKHVKGSTSDITNTTSTQVIAADASLKIYVTHLLIQNSHATVSTWVLVQDGSGGTTIYQAYAAAVGGGASITLPVPISTTAATGLFVACVTTGANVRVSASGYVAA